MIELVYQAQKKVRQDFMNDIKSSYLNDFDDSESLQADGKNASCFFTGHRNLPAKKDGIIASLKQNISYLYSLGVRDFHSGGAIGFDITAATVVIDLKRFHPGMRLILNLPFHNQTELWNNTNKNRYEYILKNSDEVVYSYDGIVKGKTEAVKYLLKRNYDLVDSSRYGIAYFSGAVRSGTGHTLAYAKKCGCEIINIFDEI